MNKDWSEMNKEMQALLSKETTYRDAISKLIELRAILFGQITDIVTNYPQDVGLFHLAYIQDRGYCRS